jgi:hypothetical protein
MSIHWGDWVRARMLFLGFRRQRDFADAVGCTQERTGSWLKLQAPPVAIKKGFDRSLCRELRTDAFTLFTNYRNVTPEAAPILGTPRKPAPPVREAFAA